MKAAAQFSWRIVWYSVLIWGLTFILAGFVILPWFYLVLPLVYFFKKSERTLVGGLWVGLFWFFIIIFLNFLEVIGPYYANFSLYFSDFRNWFLYPLVLLIPVVYTLILENTSYKKSSNSKHHFSNRHQVRLHKTKLATR